MLEFDVFTNAPPEISVGKKIITKVAYAAKEKEVKKIALENYDKYAVDAEKLCKSVNTKRTVWKIGPIVVISTLVALRQTFDFHSPIEQLGEWERSFISAVVAFGLGLSIFHFIKKKFDKYEHINDAWREIKRTVHYSRKR